MNYEELLKRARNNMPKGVQERERFEIPKVVGHIEGNKTIISNFLQIASMLRRPPDHILKFVLKELAAPGEIREKDKLLILGTKIPAARINEKIRQYSNEFVFCACGKPDTEIIKEDNMAFLKCSACGTKRSVKIKI